MFTNRDHTFVVCAYSESDYLEECVRSILDQKIKTACIISTSTPNNRIKEVSSKFEIPLYINEGESGIAHDWNCAVSHCMTPLVTIAHQDDVYLPSYSETMLSHVNSARKPLIFFSNYGEIRNGVDVDNNALLSVKRALLSSISKRGFLSKTKDKRNLLRFGSSICCPSVTLNVHMLPKPIFLSNMKSNLDWEAWERFSSLDGDFVYSSDILMRHRIHEDSETTALIRDDTRSLEDLYMLSKFWPKPVAVLINHLYSLSFKSNSIS